VRGFDRDHRRLRRNEEGVVAHFCRPNSMDAISSIDISLPGVVHIGFWGGGPGGQDLEITVLGAPIVRVRYLRDAAGIPHLRIFELMGVGAGTTILEAKVPGSGARYSAPLRIQVGQSQDADLDSFKFTYYYHGTSLERARELIGMDLVPFTVPEARLLDVNEYTDFGKGFYCHPEESKQKAIEWARRRHAEWGVAGFSLTAEERRSIAGTPLYFPDKRRTRPANAPILFDSQRANWIEFVEFNRHVRRPTIQRPKDNDWTADYPWMRGPIWGRKDSGLPGAPGLPEMYHQINWGLKGLAALNAKEAKQRRFLITKDSDPSPSPPR
jgi:hypothetical protein